MQRPTQVLQRLTLLQIHFERLIDLVDRGWARGLDLARTRTELDGEKGLLRATIPAPSGLARTLLLRLVPEGEGEDESRRALLGAYLDCFLNGREPDRLLAVRFGSPLPAVHARKIVDGGDGPLPFRLPYLEIELGAEPFDLTSAPAAGNLRPIHTPFRRESPCNSVSSVYPSRERRLCSIR